VTLMKGIVPARIRAPYKNMKNPRRHVGAPPPDFVPPNRKARRALEAFNTRAKTK
jgi:hypothetical protein